MPAGLVPVRGVVKPASVSSQALIEQIAREQVKKIGYEQNGFHWKNMKVEVLLHLK